MALSVETFMAFSFSALMLSLSPGPSNLYILACTIGSGRLGGIAAATGMALGSVLYAIATAFGLSAVIFYFPMLFIVIKISGAIYLIYLAIAAFRYAKAPHLRKPVKAEPAVVMKRSLLIELTNPKTALFFIAFLPQFTQASGGSVQSDLLVLGILYSLIAFSCDLGVVQLSHKIGLWMAKYPIIVVRQEQFVGAIFLILGLSLLGDVAYNALTLS
jgi:threonine/homoserine/homoserine lactone efflux protein